MDESAGLPLGRYLVGRGVISEEQLEEALAWQRSRGERLGEILTERGWLSPLSLALALASQECEGEPESASQPRMDARQGRGGSWRSLGAIVVEAGYVSEIELKQALAEQRHRGGFLGEILVKRECLSSADLVRALACQLGLELRLKSGFSPEGENAVILPAGRPPARFQVLEGPEGSRRLLETAATFIEATDFVFEEVFAHHEPDELQIVRFDLGEREIVWSYRKEDQAMTPSGDDLRRIFGYPVRQWQAGHALYPEKLPIQER